LLGHHGQISGTGSGQERVKNKDDQQPEVSAADNQIAAFPPGVFNDPAKDRVSRNQPPELVCDAEQCLFLVLNSIEPQRPQRAQRKMQRENLELAFSVISAVSVVQICIF